MFIADLDFSPSRLQGSKKHRISDLDPQHSSPGPLIILIALFRIFSITCEDIRNTGCTICVSDSGVKQEYVLKIFVLDTVDYGYQISD